MPASRRHLLLAAIALAGAVGGHAATAAPRAATVLRLSDRDAGTARRITVGDTVAIALPERPSTGFVWGVDWASGGFVETQPAVHQRPAGGAGRAVGGAGSVTYS